MTVAEFRHFLVELARVHRTLDELQEAEALEKLAEVFDESNGLKVARFIEQIRRVRQLGAA